MKLILNAIRTFVIAVLILGGATSCAWWQKHGKRVECATIASIENAPQLLTIVTSCAAIAVDIPAIIPCIQSAAGSKWTADVIDCFTQAAAGVAVCPAVPKTIAGPPLEVRARLQEALRLHRN